MERLKKFQSLHILQKDFVGTAAGSKDKGKILSYPSWFTVGTRLHGGKRDSHLKENFKLSTTLITAHSISTDK